MIFITSAALIALIRKYDCAGRLLRKCNVPDDDDENGNEEVGSKHDLFMSATDTIESEHHGYGGYDSSDSLGAIQPAATISNPSSSSIPSPSPSPSPSKNKALKNKTKNTNDTNVSTNRNEDVIIDVSCCSARAGRNTNLSTRNDDEVKKK